MNSPYDSEPSTFLGLLLQSLSSSCNRGGSYQLLRDLVTREVNAFLWLALIIATTLLLRKVAKLFRLWYKANIIPGIPIPSFFGHCKLIAREGFTDLLLESHKRYGPVIKLWLGPTRLLVSVKDPVLIQEMLAKAKDKQPFSGKVFHRAFGKSSLFASSFEESQWTGSAPISDVPSSISTSVVPQVSHNVASAKCDLREHISPERFK